MYDLRLTMSGQGLPAGRDTGYALLNEQGITTREFQQQATYQRALEGELSKTQGWRRPPGGRACRTAEDEVFVTEQEEPTASVLLDLAPGTALSGEQIQAVTNLVSSSVQDMEPDQVTVADSSGQVLSAAGTGVTAAAGDARSQVESSTRRACRPTPRRSSTRSSAPTGRSCPCAPTSTSRSARPPRRRTRTTRAPPVSESTTTESYNGSGTPVGGVLGPENMPDAAENAGGGDSTYDKESTTANNAVGKTTEVVQGAPAP